MPSCRAGQESTATVTLIHFSRVIMLKRDRVVNLSDAFRSPTHSPYSLSGLGPGFPCLLRPRTGADTAKNLSQHSNETHLFCLAVFRPDGPLTLTTTLTDRCGLHPTLPSTGKHCGFRPGYSIQSSPFRTELSCHLTRRGPICFFPHHT